MNQPVPVSELAPELEYLQEHDFEALQLRRTLEKSWTPLPDKPEESPELAFRALWMTARGQPHSAQLAAHAVLGTLDRDEAARLRVLVKKKASGVPLAHLTERQHFMGLELRTGPQAMIPRQETELLGRAALSKLRSLVRERGEVRVLDLCTGCGNLAVACAHYEPSARLHASDLSRDAVRLARRNCEVTGVEGRVEILQGDLFEPFERPEYMAKFDLVICNPPYISSAKVIQMHPEISGFEPELAFDGGAYGVSVIMKLMRHSPRFLKPGSWLGFEVGFGQGPALARQMQRNPDYTEVETVCDEQDAIRVLFARTAPGQSDAEGR